MLRTLFVSFGVFFALTAIASDGFVVQSMDVSYHLHKDGSMRVEEQIVVLFTESKRGIIRSIPYSYENRYGFRRRIFITHIGVFDKNNVSQPILLSTGDGNINIRIGEEDVWLPAGTTKEYIIRYRVRNMLNWFDESDWEPTVQFYWNVTGDQWTAEIEKTSFTIYYPETTSDQAIRMRVFHGPYGSITSDILDQRSSGYEGVETGTWMTIDNNKATGLNEIPLPPGSGLTVVLDLPAELIPRPSGPEAVKLFLLANPGFFIPVVVLILVVFVWMFLGRDPRPGPVVVQYDPPDAITGPEAGALLDERVDKRDIAAGIFSLAVKGYLEIHIKETSFFIFKRPSTTIVMTDKEDDGNLTKFEKTLLTHLRKIGTNISEQEMRNGIGPKLSELQSKLYDSLVGHGFYYKSPAKVRLFTIIVGIAVVVGICVLVGQLTPPGSDLGIVIGGIVGGLIVLVFSKLMPRRTKAGVNAWSKTKGFEEFIRRAHGKELDWMSKKPPTSELFETFLPHAIAFGLATQWANAFKDILLEPPSWFIGPSGRGWNSNSFAYDIGRIANGIGEAAGTPPRSSGASGGSSGFGGGGFSGGGFGGGGGSSW